MVSKQSVESQLIRLGFNYHSWVNRAEIRELPNIILPDEEIYECVNGYYEGGFALLVATNIRVLLIDKKPFNYLTVEDLRFDMINEMDYSHRMMGATISISVGTKNLRFRSYNQPRLRKLINHVQHCIAEIKKRQSDHQEGQQQHLQQINQQLQAYLLAQYQSQIEFHQRLREAQSQGTDLPQPPMVKPNPELADYLFSQSLLRQQAEQHGSRDPEPASDAPTAPVPMPDPRAADAQAADLYAEGHREIFGKLSNTYHLPPASPSNAAPRPAPVTSEDLPPAQGPQLPPFHSAGLEINALRIAYSKLPMALRNRKFGRPSFHAHSQAPGTPISPTQPQPAS